MKIVLVNADLEVSVGCGCRKAAVCVNLALEVTAMEVFLPAVSAREKQYV